MDPPWIPGGSPLDPRWIPGGSPVGSVKTRRPGNGHQNDLRPPSGRLDPAFFWRACNPPSGPVFATVLRLFSDQTKHLVSSFNMENDQRIKAHLLRWFPAILKKCMIFGLVFLASVFRLFTHQTGYFVSSFNMENDQRIKARLLRWFPDILKKHMIFGLAFFASVLRLFTHQTRYGK